MAMALAAAPACTAAMDLASGALRPVSPSRAWSMGRAPGIITLRGANYLLGADYVYLGWAGDPPSRPSGAARSWPRTAPTSTGPTTGATASCNGRG